MKTQETLPIDFHTETLSDQSTHWHEHIEIIYVIEGDLNLSLRGQHYHLLEDQLIFIHSYELHTLSGQNCRIASFELRPHFIDPELAYIYLLRYDCNSCTHENEASFTQIKKQLAHIVKNQFSDDLHKEYLQKAYFYELLYLLNDGFLIERIEEVPSKGNLKLEEVLSYLNQNYYEKINLKDLADRFFISSTYLSSAFKKQIGVGFFDYLSTIRLSHAMSDLANPNWSIEYISQKNGFSNARSFSSAFFEMYHKRPNEYRKELIDRLTLFSKTKSKSIDNSLGFQQHQSLGRLASYLDMPKSSFTQNELPLSTSDSKIFLEELAPISSQAKGSPLRHSFKEMTSVGKAKHLLFAPIQERLREIQQDIGFRYIHFHGIFDDDMMIFSQLEDGSPQFNFAYIDLAFDFLLSIGLRPFIELGFMPKHLASDPKRILFHQESNLSLPKDFHCWSELVQSFTKHLLSRYGYEEVKNWPFSLWTTPDTPKDVFGFDPKEDYFHFYKISYLAVKSVHPKLLFGTPSLMNITLEEDHWLEEFMSYCNKEQLEPDFLQYHFYPINLKKNSTLGPLQIGSKILLLRSENALHESLQKIRKNLRAAKLSFPKTYINQWNSSISHRDLMNDTAFKACYIAKNILENYDAVDRICYWTLSDFMEEVSLSPELFHGGLGLYTHNGIKKSAYFAFLLLAKLGDTLLTQGPGYFITKKKDSYQILLYHYQHFSDLYASGELYDMTFTKRYTPFGKEKKKKVVLTLQDLPFSTYQMNETYVNRNHGSSFDLWVEMGALPLSSEAEVNYLKAASLPAFRKKRLTANEQQISITCELETHEVRLIELRPEI